MWVMSTSAAVASQDHALARKQWQNPRMTTRTIALNLTLALAFASPIAIGADLAAARTLVVAMGADDSAAVGIHLGYRALVEEGAATKVMSECMQHVESGAFTDTFAKVLADQLSPEELQQALAFYQSDPGKKFVVAQSVSTYEQFGYPPPQQKPQLTEAESAAVDAFGQTPAGTKLLGDAVLTNSDQGRQAARAKILELQDACEKKQ